jgi:hypothetical protein
MDKRNAVIAVSWVLLGALFVEYRNLSSDFRMLLENYKEDQEQFELAKEIVTEIRFAELAERFEED